MNVCRWCVMTEAENPCGCLPRTSHWRCHLALIVGSLASLNFRWDANDQEAITTLTLFLTLILKCISKPENVKKKTYGCCMNSNPWTSITLNMIWVLYGVDLVMELMSLHCILHSELVFIFSVALSPGWISWVKWYFVSISPGHLNLCFSI